MEETVRYSYRLRPGATAERALLAEWDRCRFIWNECVHQEQLGKRPNIHSLGKALTKARKRFSWLRDGSSAAQQATVWAYDRALRRSHDIPGRARPKMKLKGKSRPSLEYTARNFTLRDGRLCLPKGIIIPIVWSRDLPSEPSSVRVYQDNLGYWYVSFVVRVEFPVAPEVDGAIGIDWGVTVTATTTDPTYNLPYQGFRKRCAAELARAQKKMSRRRRPKGQAPSKGYRDARLQAAKIQKKAARQNQQAIRVWAKRVVDNHQLIAIEDFEPQFLAKTKMARKAADAAIGTAKRELIKQGTRAGRTVVLVPPAYTSMTCSECFARAKQRLGLGERTFVCGTCGYTADRDENAARFIRATAERNRASADVRHVATSPRGSWSPAVRAGKPRDSFIGRR